MGICQALRQALRREEPVLPRSVMIRYAVGLASVSGSPQPLDPAEIRLLLDEINAAVDVPTYWELEARTVEKG